MPHSCRLAALSSHLSAPSAQRAGSVGASSSTSRVSVSVDPQPKTVVLTGANRGLGLEFVRQYLAAEAAVRLHACCRSPSAAAELQALAAASGGLVTVHALDVTSDDSVAALAAELAGVAVDVLINNSGVNPDPLRQRFDGELDYSEWAETMNVNGEPSQFRRLGPVTTEGWSAVFGVARVTRALLPSLLLSPQKKLIHISSNAGSIATQTRAGRPPGRTQLMYRSSKAALNMGEQRSDSDPPRDCLTPLLPTVAKLMDVELAGEGVLSLIIHPGHVQCATPQTPPGPPPCSLNLGVCTGRTWAARPRRSRWSRASPAWSARSSCWSLRSTAMATRGLCGMTAAPSPGEPSAVVKQ